VAKLSSKTKEENLKKKERHLMKKEFIESKVQPGAHQNIFKMSDFGKVKPKDEIYHNFGSTDAKIAEVVISKNPNVGPGSYDVYAKSFMKRANTA